MRKCTNRLLKKQKLKPQCFGPYAMRLLENYILDKDDFAGKQLHLKITSAAAEFVYAKIKFFANAIRIQRWTFLIQTNKTEVYGPKNGIKTQNVPCG